MEKLIDGTKINGLIKKEKSEGKLCFFCRTPIASRKDSGLDNIVSLLSCPECSKKFKKEGNLW